ncbi:SMODS domain-containing nucleotidyltransferase [Priestia aryabhattai]
MGVSENFSTFCRNLRMSQDTVDNISYRAKRITKQINKDFWKSSSDTDHSFYAGSYGRGTDIHVSDIDLLIRLPYSTYQRYNNYYGNGQSALLQEVKNSIEKTFRSHKRADGQVVQVSFKDGVSYEIVPCFVNDDNSYTYPDTNNSGSWKVTNPKAEIKEMTRLNNQANKNLKRLCRMMRAWKSKWEVPISGFLIDTLAYQFMKKWPYSDKSYLYYDFMVRDFLFFLSQQDSTQLYWSAPGSGQRVYRKGIFEHKARKCYNLALEAIEMESKGYEYTTKQKWREIFGNKYPL